MNGIALAAMLLVAALTALPVPPRHRFSRRAAADRRCRPTTAALFLLVAGLALATTVSPAAVVGGAALAALGVSRRRRSTRRARARRETAALAAALEMLGAELRAGAHPVQAFAAAAGESPPPVADALRTVAARARFGSDVVAGLRDVAARSTAPASWERVAVCWSLAAEHGLPMSTLMNTAQADLAARHDFADRVDAALSGARATAVILALLPLLGVLLGELIGAHPTRLLLGSTAGGVLLIAGVALVCLGVGWADHIIDSVAR